jgi:hypothetical protein
MMPSSPEPDISAQAELMTFLVVSQLVKRHLTGRWLKVEHVVESTHLWLHVNGGGIDWIQRVMLASRAQELAAHVTRVSTVRFDARTLAGAFVDYRRLDYKSPAVAEVYRTCLLNVIRKWQSAGNRARSDER